MRFPGGRDLGLGEFPEGPSGLHLTPLHSPHTRSQSGLCLGPLDTGSAEPCETGVWFRPFPPGAHWRPEGALSLSRCSQAGTKCSCSCLPSGLSLFQLYGKGKGSALCAGCSLVWALLQAKPDRGRVTGDPSTPLFILYPFNIVATEINILKENLENTDSTKAETNHPKSCLLEVSLFYFSFQSFFCVCRCEHSLSKLDQRINFA